MSRPALVLAIGSWFLISLAGAQSAAGGNDPRADLEMRKREQTARFDAQEQACSTVFAVTDCVNEVNARRRAVVAVLRKEENALNEVERRQRERERLESLQEKARQRALQAPKVEDKGESLEERQQRQQDKQAQHAPQSTARPAPNPKESSQIDKQSREKNAADYAARQKAAEARRAARDKKLKERGKAVDDLPTPP